MKIQVVLAFLVPCLIITNSMSIKVSLNNPETRIYASHEVNAMRNIKLMIDGNGNYIYPESITSNEIKIPTFTGGVHIVEVISTQYTFPVLVIDQRVEGLPKMKWLNPIDRKMMKVVHEPVVMPIDKIQYFEAESGFSVAAFLASGNGMFLMMGVMMFFCYKGLGKLGESQMAPPAPNQRPN